MDLGLSGKVAVVTGASRGIGHAIVRTLAEEGCRVVAAARSADKLEALRAEIAAKGGDVAVLALDLREPEAPSRLVEHALASFGRVDIIVANAGSAEAGDFVSLADELWMDAFALKFFGHMRLIRSAWPALQKSSGVVVIIAGFAGRTPPAEAAINGSVNGALLTFTKALANRGRVDRVRINAVNPGQIRTARFEKRVAELVNTLSISPAEAEAKMAQDYGMIRTGEPADVADLVAFAVSERAGFLHGAIIDLDGGMTKTV